MNKKQEHIITITFTAILLLTIFAAPVSAADLHVGTGQTYSAIQDAIDAASPHDTIIVHDGTYTENVDVNVSHLTIRSENGSAVTIVHAANSDDDVVVVTGNYLNLSGFTVTGATGSYGIYLENGTDYCNISNNNISNNSDGIFLWNSSNNTLTNNTANSNENGIFLILYSDNNTLTNNTVNSNVDGIDLWSSNNNILINNTVNSNMDGIDLFGSDNNILTNNTVNSNECMGIKVRWGYNNVLTNNIVNSNLIGIELCDSSNNHIYNNYFNNTNNAWDDGTNTWNITVSFGTNIIGGPYLGGNYWSNYAGVDTDKDGLGDTLRPYNSSGNIQTGGDYLPLVPVLLRTYTISLSSGWNLISAPLNLIIRELGNESIVGDPLNVTPKSSLVSIYRYNATSGSFEKCDYFDNWGWSPATGSENFTELESGRGYWVMADQDCVLTFDGTSPFDLNISINKDWNLVGWYSISEALLGEEAIVGDPLNVTPENSLVSIYRYKTTTGSFEKCNHFPDWGWGPSTGSEGFTRLEPGRGYWVMAVNDCEWQYRI